MSYLEIHPEAPQSSGEEITERRWDLWGMRVPSEELLNWPHTLKHTHTHNPNTSKHGNILPLFFWLTPLVLSLPFHLKFACEAFPATWSGVFHDIHDGENCSSDLPEGKSTSLFWMSVCLCSCFSHCCYWHFLFCDDWLLILWWDWLSYSCIPHAYSESGTCSERPHCLIQ